MNSSQLEPERDPRQQLEWALELGRKTYRFRHVALAVLLVGELICLAYLLLRTPRYRSQMVLLYNEAITTAETGEPAGPPKSLAVRMQEMLMSRRQLAALVREYDLYSDVAKTYGSSAAIDELKKHIEFRAPGGDTFTIAFEGVTPEQAQKVTERLGLLVIEQDAEVRRRQAVSARDFLAGEKKRAAGRLKDAEQQLAAFMAEHPRFAMDATPLATGAAIRASAPVGTAGDVATGSTPRLVQVPMFGAKPGVGVRPPTPRAPPSEAQLARAREAQQEHARAQAALAAARENLNEKRTRYTDAHPDVQAARDAVERARRRAEAAYLKVPVVASGPAKVRPETEPYPEPTPQVTRRYVRAPAANGAAKPAASVTSAEELVELETSWARLTRAVTGARQRHDQVESALFKADIASSSATGEQGTRVSVIDPAFLPQRQVPPGPRTLAALFFLLSFFAALAVAVGCALLDDRIHDARGAEGLLDVLAEIPGIKKPRRGRA